MEWGRVEAQDAGARFGGRDLRDTDDLSALFDGADFEEEDDDVEVFGVLQVLHGWVGPSGPGAALRFRLHTDLDPGIAGLELRLRDDARYVRSPLRPFQDRHGDLTVALPLPSEGDDGRLVHAHLPYAALPRRLGEDLALEAWLVEDGEPVEEALWGLELPDPGVRRLDNPLAAVAMAAVSAEAAGFARARGPALVEAGRARRIESALAALFRLDAVGRGVLAALVEESEAEGDRMAAARLRARVAPEGVARVLATLEALAGPTPAPGEAAWIAALAARLGTTSERARAKGPRGRRAGPSPATEGHLRTLDLGPGATWDEVRAAYRKAATQHHPDRAGEAGQAAANERMKAINAAYAALRRGMGRGR